MSSSKRATSWSWQPGTPRPWSDTSFWWEKHNNTFLPNEGHCREICFGETLSAQVNWNKCIISSQQHLCVRIHCGHMNKSLNYWDCQMMWLGSGCFLLASGWMSPICVIEVSCRMQDCPLWRETMPESVLVCVLPSVHVFCVSLDVSSTTCCYTACPSSVWEGQSTQWGRGSALTAWRSWKRSTRTTLILSRCQGRKGHWSYRPGTFYAEISHSVCKCYVGVTWCYCY